MRVRSSGGRRGGGGRSRLNTGRDYGIESLPLLEGKISAYLITLKLIICSSGIVVRTCSNGYYLLINTLAQIELVSVLKLIKIFNKTRGRVPLKSYTFLSYNFL